MENQPRRKPPKRSEPADPLRPKIWAKGGQRPPVDLRATGRASLHLSRLAVATLLAWTSRQTRRGALGVRDGAGRIPSDALAGAARFLPSHLRVAGWIKNLAAVLGHASATADPDIKRGNALVAEIEPHLWDQDAASAPAPAFQPPPPPEAPTAPVVLREPASGDYDPLSSIREELANQPAPEEVNNTPDTPNQPPAPPGLAAVTAIQITGYLIGWASAILALPYGLIRALWLYAKGVDLRTIAVED